MPRQPRHEQALEILVRKKEQTLARDPQFRNMSGYDVEDPIKYLAMMMDIGRVSAMNHLHRLERADAIRIIYGVGREIIGANIKKPSLEKSYHEFEDEERTVDALNAYKRQSQRFDGALIVHPRDFPHILADADLDQTRFYAILGSLEEKGLIEKIYQANRRRLLVIKLTKQFPATVQEVTVE